MPHSLDLRVGEEPTQECHLEWIASEALNQRLMVLACKQRCRHEQCDLLTVLHCLECSPHRYLGLPESNVRANKSIHRPRGLHIGFDVLNGLSLIRSRRIRKCGLHLFLPRSISRELETLGGESGLIQRHELFGDLRGRSLGLRPSPLPIRPSHSRQGWGLPS
ncbi:unannotated protein [freshwater metagenome]|uniref:Unannotated protein n=1 Tax=freshwater metagenome TaxID=449393 RepID=A0A6J7AP56_9ZZZZ